MKKSIIKDIFYGDRGNMETMKCNEKCQEKLKSINKTYDELKDKLSPELLTLHQRFVDALENNWGSEIDFYFVEGFKLGLLIGIEAME